MGPEIATKARFRCAPPAYAPSLELSAPWAPRDAPQPAAKHDKRPQTGARTAANWTRERGARCGWCSMATILLSF